MRRSIGSLICTTALAAASIASAQTSNFGTVSLSPGFAPDPQVITGRSGGSLQATSLNAACQGWVSATPDHILVLNSGFNFLRVFVESANDVTVVVQGPSGQFYCNDDTFGTNPALSQAWSAGTYRLWVGSYQQGQVADYVLKVTELQSVTPATGTATANAPTPTTTAATAATNGNSNAIGSGALELTARRGNYKPVKVRSGFKGDPKLLRGRSGGSVDARTISAQCRGWVARKPDHILTLQGAFDFFRIFTRSDTDTTLLVMTPDGRWLCADDTFAKNPAVDQESWVPGRYLVWVGSYNSGEVQPYQIGFTEYQNVH